MDGLTLEIRDFGSIDEAKINLKKINIIGGINGSGKSTASKLLYCFLNAMSSNRKEYLLENILSNVNSILTKEDNLSNNKKSSHNDLTTDDDFKTIERGHLLAKKVFNRLTFNDDGIEEIIRETDKLIPIFENDNNRSYSPVIKSLFKNESLTTFKGDAMIYNDSFKCIANYNPTKDGLNNRYSELKRKNIPFDDFDENRTYFTEGTFDYIYDIFYIDSVSVFDLDYYINTKNALKCIYSYKEHLSYLLKQLRDDNSDSDLPDDVKNQINDVNEKISRIIGGESYYSPILSLGNFKEEAYFFKPDDDEQLRVNISSGIQQISIIQILLHNHKLLPGTFMIIDEPEVNLHPEWQIKFAEILILLVKELDIKLYMNSHSPMFIEAISLYSQFYNLLDETNIYITQKSEDKKYIFEKIDSKDMGAVYENLTSPYDKLDELKAKIIFKE